MYIKQEKKTLTIKSFLIKTQHFRLPEEPLIIKKGRIYPLNLADFFLKQKKKRVDGEKSNF